MSLSVRNELPNPFVFNEGGRRKVVQPNQVVVLSDAEWDIVIPSKRGVGAMNPLGTDEETKTNLDYNGTGDITYYGTADQTTLDSDPLWTIKKFSYTTFGSSAKITQIQVITNAIWTNRASLGWT